MSKERNDRRGDDRGPGFATRAIHDADLNLAGIAEQPVSPPIWLTADYLYDDLDHYADVINERRPGYVYGRYGNPTHVALHRVLASLEGAEAAWSFASGMAAVHAALSELVQAGDHVLAARTIYGGTHSLLTRTYPRMGVEVSFADAERDAVREALRPQTKAVLIEVLANPTFRVADVGGIAEVCAERGVALVVDNSVSSPVLLRPMEIPGVTLVVEATTKYINGHADMIGGAVAGPASLLTNIRKRAIDMGTTAGAFEAWLTLRGVQTLPLRMARQCATALQLAEVFASHRKVKEVGYCGLPRHRDHERATALFGGAGYGAMLAVDVDGGYDAAQRACQALQLARVGSSFGSLRTEVCHPATTSHRQLSASHREAAGIGDGLLRVAVGGEDPADLLDDFTHALEKA
ncbi:MAG TPA: cystathionine beta-lyase [Actinobacteria bacterium]|nr:cystathionine beta-lyase [Actinomycetota bacterium]